MSRNPKRTAREVSLLKRWLPLGDEHEFFVFLSLHTLVTLIFDPLTYVVVVVVSFFCYLYFTGDKTTLCLIQVINITLLQLSKIRGVGRGRIFPLARLVTRRKPPLYFVRAVDLLK